MLCQYALSSAPLYAIARYQLLDRNHVASATTGLLSAAFGFYALLPAGFKANYLDVTQIHTGAVSAIGNTLGSVSSFAGPKFVGSVLDW